MRHLRHLVLPALVLALCSPAVASPRLLPPDAKVDGITGGDGIGEKWVLDYTLPPDQNSWFGNAEPCVRLGRTGSVLLGLEFQPVPCNVERGTSVLIWGITWACDNASEFVDPSSFGATKAAQIRCAVAGLRDTESVVLTLDGVRRTDLRVPRYFTCSPQRRVVLRSDNPFGYDPGHATLTACGWVAWLTDLPRGRHTVQTVSTFTGGFQAVISLVVNVTRTR